MSPSSLVESLDYQPTICAMKIIEPLDNEPEKTEAEKADAAENQPNTKNDDAGDKEPQFAPWDE